MNVIGDVCLANPTCLHAFFILDVIVISLVDSYVSIVVAIHVFFSYDWGPNFVIWAKDWRNVSSTTVALYEARIQEFLGEAFEFIEKPPPVDPQAPYDGEYIEN